MKSCLLSWHVCLERKKEFNGREKAREDKKWIGKGHKYGECGGGGRRGANGRISMNGRVSIRWSRRMVVWSTSHSVHASVARKAQISQDERCIGKGPLLTVCVIVPPASGISLLYWERKTFVKGICCHLAKDPIVEDWSLGQEPSINNEWHYLVLVKFW